MKIERKELIARIVLGCIMIFLLVYVIPNLTFHDTMKNIIAWILGFSSAICLFIFKEIFQ